MIVVVNWVLDEQLPLNGYSGVKNKIILVQLVAKPYVITLKCFTFPKFLLCQCQNATLLPNPYIDQERLLQAQGQNIEQ